MSKADAHSRHDFSRRQTSVSPSAFIADNATVLGQVTIGDEASVWFSAVIRGDRERIEIGEQSNVQDLCLLHADPGYPCLIGARVTIGHRAVVHGAIVEEGALIGIGAIVLNGARIGRGSIVGAGCLVPENRVVPANTVVMGVPAKEIRSTHESDRQRNQQAVQNYVEARLQAQVDLRNGS